MTLTAGAHVALLLLMAAGASSRGASPDSCQSQGACAAPVYASDHVLLQHRVGARSAAAAAEPGEGPPAIYSDDSAASEGPPRAWPKPSWPAARGEVRSEWHGHHGERWLDSRAGTHWHRPGSLRECQGHCRSDSDCAAGLRCFERKGTVIVPGCQGEGNDGWSYCHKDPPPPPPPSSLPAPPAGGARMRLAAFNVYYLALGSAEREAGIATALAAIQADVYVITEEWNEKMDILRQLREKSGRNYAVCNGGAQERSWDGDIMYDADVWRRLDDGVHDWGNDRGLSWAQLQHIVSGKKVLVYGAHPLCCGNEEAHLRNAVDFVSDLHAHHPEYPESPVVIMGDFNALEDWSSVELYENGVVSAYGREWHLPMTFRDAFRETHSRFDNADTHNTHARLDYIFTENRQPPVFETTASYIWRGAPGGSDHFPIIADVVLLP